MIGPYDLSASLGVTAEFDNPLFLESIEKVRRVITDMSQMAVHIVMFINTLTNTMDMV